MGFEQSIVEVNPGYPRLGSGAIGVAPSAAVAVDNPPGLSSTVGSGTNRPDELWMAASLLFALQPAYGTIQQLLWSSRRPVRRACPE